MPDFYTRTGDNGTTGWLGSGRLPKDDARIEAVGAIDEANATLGIVRSQSKQNIIKELILPIQKDLYQIMAELAASPNNAEKFRKIDIDRIEWLEDQIKILGNQVKLPNDFILPGDTKLGAILDFTRTVIRRAERRVTTLNHESAIENEFILPYLNRLSSLCFLLEISES
jgi:cob(I)alamin adenosyltransferase